GRRQELDRADLKIPLDQDISYELANGSCSARDGNTYRHWAPMLIDKTPINILCVQLDGNSATLLMTVRMSFDDTTLYNCIGESEILNASRHPACDQCKCPCRQGNCR